jgi:hypothetical protein
LKDAYTRACAYLENGHDGVEIRNGIEKIAYEVGSSIFRTAVRFNDTLSILSFTDK